MITPLHVPSAPPAVGPYSHAVLCSGRMLYLSGQIALDDSGTLIDGSVTEQTRRALQNVSTILASLGATLQNVVKTLVLLQNMDDFAAMNAAYAEAFGTHQPARSAFAVSALPKGALVEIEVIACLDS